MEKVIIRTRSPELNEFLATWISILFPECEIESQSHNREEPVSRIHRPMSNLDEKGSRSKGDDNSNL